MVVMKFQVVKRAWLLVSKHDFSAACGLFNFEFAASRRRSISNVGVRLAPIDKAGRFLGPKDWR
jgi:hypothetical protein